MSDERLQHLEARFAWLERHVLEQDKAMLEMGEDLRRLGLAVKALKERLGPSSDSPPSEPIDERPPHY